MTGRATIDTAAVEMSTQERLDWRHKAIPPALHGRTLAEVRDARPRLSELPTPLLTLARPRLDANRRALTDWCADHHVELAPHGKTSMAPQLWAEQLAAGAWGITVANAAQLEVARAFGVSRVMVANTVISPLALRWIVDDLQAHPGHEVWVWADDVETVRLMDEALAAHVAAVGPRPRLKVLVERGGAGGRTGARDLETAVAVGQATAASSYLELAGVAGYEGALAHTTDAAALDVVRGYLTDLAGVHESLRDGGLYDDGVTPVVTAGGSAYFELVADVLGPLGEQGATVVLRSGAYLVHDDGFYRYISPLGSEPRTDGARLTSAMHGWVRVTSTPEPGLALADAGKRDLPFDEGLPEVQLRRPRTAGDEPQPLTGVTVTAVNDQHAFLSFDPAATDLRIGDELRLGLSHPCTAFDKWTVIPVIDDPDAADPVVLDLVRTWF